MLGLPQRTELSRQLSKQLVYKKFSLNTRQQERFDCDISRMFIVNEVSQRTVAIPEGAETKLFFVLRVELKTADYDRKNIELLSRIVPQHLLLVLQFEDKARLAVCRQVLMQTEWLSVDDFGITLDGADLDQIWQHVIMTIGQFELHDGNDIDTQIEQDERNRKLLAQIDALQKKAMREKQPRKKWDLMQQVKELKQQLL